MTINTDPLFVAMTRPVELWGVPVAGLLINGLVCMEIFLLSHAVWTLLIAPVTHYALALMVRQERKLIELLTLNLALSIVTKRRPLAPHHIKCLPDQLDPQYWPITED